MAPSSSPAPGQECQSQSRRWEERSWARTMGPRLVAVTPTAALITPCFPFPRALTQEATPCSGRFPAREGLSALFPHDWGLGPLLGGEAFWWAPTLGRKQQAGHGPLAPPLLWPQAAEIAWEVEQADLSELEPGSSSQLGHICSLCPEATGMGQMRRWGIGGACWGAYYS